MGYQLITPPASEPITLADAKTHLRVDIIDDDALITALIVAARQYAEQITARSFISQQWRYVMDALPSKGVMGVPWGSEFSLPGNAILLEKGPIISVDSIKFLDMSSVQQTLPTTAYTFDLSGPLARITPPFGQIWPIALPQIGAVQVNFTAGYGASAAAVPQGIKQWMLLRVAALYENREEVVTGRSITVTPLSFADGLLDPYRIMRA